MHQLPDELISALLDGELSAEEQERVERALRDDSAWRETYDDLLVLRQTLQALPRQESPAPDTSTTLRRAEREMLREPVSLAAAARPVWQRPATWVGLATAACLAVLLAVPLYWRASVGVVATLHDEPLEDAEALVDAEELADDVATESLGAFGGRTLAKSSGATPAGVAAADEGLATGPWGKAGPAPLPAKGGAVLGPAEDSSGGSPPARSQPADRMRAFQAQEAAPAVQLRAAQTPGDTQLATVGELVEELVQQGVLAIEVEPSQRSVDFKPLQLTLQRNQIAESKEAATRGQLYFQKSQQRAVEDLAENAAADKPPGARQALGGAAPDDGRQAPPEFWVEATPDQVRQTLNELVDSQSYVLSAPSHAATAQRVEPRPAQAGQSLLSTQETTRLVRRDAVGQSRKLGAPAQGGFGGQPSPPAAGAGGQPAAAQQDVARQRATSRGAGQEDLPRQERLNVPPLSALTRLQEKAAQTQRVRVMFVLPGNRPAAPSSPPK